MLHFDVKGDKRFLVIARVGDSSLHREWLKPSQYKNFDLCLSYFGSEPNRFAEDCDFYHARPGVKWPILREIVDAFGEGIAHYDAIWLPDDDISTNAYNINRMFELFMQYDLELAQPALTKDSYYSHKVTVVNPNYSLRYSNFVEPMVPIYSRDAFKLLLPTFAKSEAAYGLDFVWPKILGYSNRKIGIIDEVSVKHTRPVGGGTLYQNIKRNRWDDFHSVTREYDVKVNWHQTHYDGIPKGKKVMFALLAQSNREVLAAQLENIRHFNPNAGIVVYNGTENKDIAKELDVAVCPYSHPLRPDNTAAFFWDVMRWLEQCNVDYEYLVNLDSEMLFVKKNFHEYLDLTMKYYDCMGWGLEETDSEDNDGSQDATAIWQEFPKWESVMSSNESAHYQSFAQVYRRKTISRILSSVDPEEVSQKLHISEAGNLQQFFFAALASTVNAKCREYPSDLILNVMRQDNEVGLEEARQAVYHPYYYFIHPVRGERLMSISRWLLEASKKYERKPLKVVQQAKSKNKQTTKNTGRQNTAARKIRQVPAGGKNRQVKNKEPVKNTVTNAGRKPAPALIKNNVRTPSAARKIGKRV